MQHHLPGVPVETIVGPIPPPMMGMGYGMPMPFGPMFPFGHIQSAGPLAPPRLPWNTPGLMGNPSTSYGACVPGIPWLGFPGGDVLPEPPGTNGCIPPFIPGAPLWSAGAIPAVGTGMGMPVGFGMGGFWPGMHRPAPPVITEAVAPEQPKQGDITSLPGGVPPGATLVQPDAHSIVHVLKGPHMPWLNHSMPMEVEILYVSCSTSINRLIQVCNNNQDCEGWGLSECHEMVNGTWEKGQTFVYGEPMSMVLTLGDAGFDKKRNRPGGKSLHVYLHKI